MAALETLPSGAFRFGSAGGNGFGFGFGRSRALAISASMLIRRFPFVLLVHPAPAGHPLACPVISRWSQHIVLPAVPW
jgi:hypothetical protein